MDTPNSKYSPKFAKTSSQIAVQSSPRGVMRQKSPPPLATKKPSLVSPKSPAKENTKPQEIKLHTQQRAVKRAMFNYSVATKLYLLEQQKKQVEKLQKMIEEEEIRMLRKEMIPRAQLMPLFDRPFFPQRSNRPLTVPREPSFHFASSNCSTCSEPYTFFNTMKPIK
ncbi:microtubule-destabilizing protein 60 [Cornus florida]|uniref:microtubule-destabilizing protein 60 n=1 Tax=Cornus florida TaxID=4283 RepID=UPI002899224A|nr:microtubule-destabilizing protein 60 [Cornus florida]